jgi:hypothetical protein
MREQLATNVTETHKLSRRQCICHGDMFIVTRTVHIVVEETVHGIVTGIQSCLEVFKSSSLPKIVGLPTPETLKPLYCILPFAQHSFSRLKSDGMPDVCMPSRIYVTEGNHV